MVQQRDFTWYQGEDFAFDLILHVDNVALDLTHYEARMDIAGFDAQGNPSHRITLNSADIDDDVDQPGDEDNEMTINPNGTIHIQLSRAQTLALRDTVLVYDVFIRDMSTDMQRPVLRGNIELTQAVTKWQ